MPLTVLHIAMAILTGHLMYGLPMDGKVRYHRALLNCETMCPGGYYLSKCRCYPCPSGFFSEENNSDESCRRCFQNCKPEFNMTVVKKCTNTSDVMCDCQDGFNCTSRDSFHNHCLKCDPITPSPSSTDPPQSWLGDGVWLWILFGVIMILSIFVLTIFLRLCRKKDKECFKQFVRQCSLGNLEVESETTPPSAVSQSAEQPHAQDMSHASSNTNHNTDCSFHQPVSSDQSVPPPGNLGPLHIYGPQTVFVSLLNQFGWDCGEKKTHDLQEEPIFHSDVPYPQSPPIHLSEEERSKENDFIFFPSQEQGKECHISKEEVL